ncbi:hypothetical protein [Mycolicibacterium sp.]|uniref:hypothetical protein n=1 Tax=Mycolicibacterium sp. TaxID=2320850 RepID=UPI0037CB25BB
MAFELDLEGGAEVLKVLAAGAIADLTQQIADAAGEGATVEMSTTDRARGSVSVPAEAQAKDGVLTRAASAAGLEVTLRPPRQRKSRSRKSKSRKGAAGDAASDS